MDWSDKIAKLLALAESPNENEAKAALLKARELMAQHKLSESDCAGEEGAKVVKRLCGITCTAMTDPWKPLLSAIIAKNHCCTSWRQRVKGAKISEIGFIGLEGDIEVCERIFKYAVDCILHRKQMLRAAYRDYYDAAAMRQVLNAYGFGFCRGIQEAFSKQNNENQAWGLVLSVPAEVLEKAHEMKPSRYAKADFTGSRRQFGAMGYREGLKFDPGTKLKAREETR